MFGLLEGLTRAALNVAVTPLAVAADVVTLGGVLTDKERPYTAEQLAQIEKALLDALHR